MHEIKEKWVTSKFEVGKKILSLIRKCAHGISSSRTHKWVKYSHWKMLNLIKIKNICDYHISNHYLKFLTKVWKLNLGFQLLHLLHTKFALKAYHKNGKCLNGTKVLIVVKKPLIQNWLETILVKKL